MSSKKFLTGKIYEVGNRIRNIRGKLSQADFGSLLGVKAAAISKYESGRIPDSLTLNKIAHIGGVSVEWLLNGEEKRSPPQAKDEEQYQYEHRPAELDSDQLIAVIVFVRKYLKQQRQKFTDHQEAHFITYLYEYLTEHDAPPGDITVKRLAELAEGKGKS